MRKQLLMLNFYFAFVSMAFVKRIFSLPSFPILIVFLSCPLGTQNTIPTEFYSWKAFSDYLLILHLMDEKVETKS
jgi:hypothetical protein